MNYTKKVGIVCCSNGQKRAAESKLAILKETLEDMGLKPIFSNHIYEKENIFLRNGKRTCRGVDELL